MTQPGAQQLHPYGLLCFLNVSKALGVQHDFLEKAKYIHMQTLWPASTLNEVQDFGYVT